MRLRYKITVATVLCAVVATMVISAVLFDRMVLRRPDRIYGQDRTPFIEKTQRQLKATHHAEDVSFKADDGSRLVGLWIKRQHPQATLVLCHGFRGCKEMMHLYADLFPAFNLLMFDFRAHGDSEPGYISFGYHEYKDVIAATRWARERAQAELHAVFRLPVIVLGISMGGAAALMAAEADHELCDALIVDSSFADLAQTLAGVLGKKAQLPQYPFLPILKQMLNFFGSCDVDMVKPIKSVHAIDKPILFIHSCLDAMTAPDATLALYAASRNKASKLWMAPSGKHGFIHHEHPEKYTKKIIKFLKKAAIIG